MVDEMRVDKLSKKWLQIGNRTNRHLPNTCLSGKVLAFSHILIYLIQTATIKIEVFSHSFTDESIKPHKVKQLAQNHEARKW